MTEMANRRSGGIPASALGGGATAPAVQPTPMAAARPRIARGDLATIYPYGEVWIEVLGTVKHEQIEAETFRAMRALELPATDLHVGTYNYHRFRRTLALAVRDPKDHTKPFGTLEEWGDEPDDVILAGILAYKAVKNRLDPVTDPGLTEEQSEDILEAFKKKDAPRLRSFDSATLTSWLLSGAVQLSTSPTPSSKNTDTSPE